MAGRKKVRVHVHNLRVLHELADHTRKTVTCNYFIHRGSLAFGLACHCELRIDSSTAALQRERDGARVHNSSCTADFSCQDDLRGCRPSMLGRMFAVVVQLMAAHVSVET